MNFKEYLEQKKYSAVTVSKYEKGIERFLVWLKEEGLEASCFTYNDLMEFMRYCHQRGISKRSVDNLLCMVRHYCNYLISEGKRNDNPAAGVFIKGLVRKLVVNLLSREEMEELYKQYSIQLHVDSSKKIMLGLLIYQGVTVGELLRLQYRDIKLTDGKVFIRGTEQTNERLLHLHAIQMSELQNYLTRNKYKEGSLFIEKEKEITYNINNRLQCMFNQLRKLNPKVLTAKHIRSSVITEWLRNHHLRQVQYMCGHKYVSSTARYQVSNLEDLQASLKEHHPMQ